MRMESIRGKNPGLYETKVGRKPFSSTSQTSTARHTCKLVWDCVKKINFVFALAAQGGGSHI